jgi:hypothetical protein
VCCRDLNRNLEHAWPSVTTVPQLGLLVALPRNESLLPHGRSVSFVIDATDADGLEAADDAWDEILALLRRPDYLDNPIRLLHLPPRVHVRPRCGFIFDNA